MSLRNPPQQIAERLINLARRQDSLLKDQGQYLFIPPGVRANNIGDHSTVLHSGVVINYTEFTAPCDYAELISADLIFVPVSSGAVSLTVNTDLGSVGQLYNARSGGPLAATPTWVINVVTAVNVLPVLTTMLRGDQVGMAVVRVSGVTFHQLGLRLYL